MDNEKVIEKFVRKANKLLLIHILFFAGLILYGVVLAVFSDGALTQTAKYSIYIWVAISFGMEIFIQTVVMKCPVCGKSIRANTKLTFFLPSKCKHCGAVFREEPQFNGENNG